MASLPASYPESSERHPPTVDPDRRCTWALGLGLAAVVCTFSLVLAPVGVVAGAAAVVAGISGMRGWTPHLGRAAFGFVLGTIACVAGLLFFGAAGSMG